MKSMIIFLVTSVLALDLYAATKKLECKLEDEKGGTQILKAALDDDSEKAEVQIYDVTAQCAASQSCPTRVYKKTTLPSVVRLSSILDTAVISYVETIDIDRSNLTISSVSTMTTKASGRQSETKRTGSCTLKIDDSKKLI